MRLIRLLLVVGVVFGCALPRRACADDAALLAKEHFRQGSKLFDLQRYIEAAQEYEHAYEAKELPALLYNIGQAYRLGGEPKKALASYRAYLRRMPDAPNREEVNAFVEALRKTIDAQKAAQEKPPVGPIGEVPPAHAATSTSAPTATVTVTTPPRREPDQQQIALGRRLRYAGIGLGAVGVVGLALGGAFAALTVQTGSSINHPAQSTPPPVYDKSLESKGRTYETLTPVMFAVGGAALVSGVACILVGNHKIKSNSYALAPAFGPGQAALAVAGSF